MLHSTACSPLHAPPLVSPWWWRVRFRVCVPGGVTEQVAVPIKVRAILKGLTTGYNDRYYDHDNSWWVSFGASATLM